MNDPTLTCQDEQRRHEVRRQELNGLDYLEVYDDQGRPTLVVYFLNKLGEARERLKRENVLIEGGRRITDIQVVDIDLCIQEDPERDDCLQVWLDKYGDFSTYTLCLVEVDEHKQPILEGEGQGRRKYRPLDGFDPRYACLEFSFQANCPSDLDCKPGEICPPPERDEPEINYLAKDYASFRQLILDRLALIMPDWGERHVPDQYLALGEILAYAADHLSYYQDAVATEAYLDTARQRISVRRHARLVDYPMHEGCNARAWVCVKTDTHVSLNPDDVYFITGKGLPVSSTVLAADDLRSIPASQYEMFEALVEKPDEPIQLHVAHNQICFYTWGDRECCLPRGATSATLLDAKDEVVIQQKSEEPSSYEQTAPAQESQKKIYPPPEPEPRLYLKVGDILIFEEKVGPKTGNPADADPNHRHAVRLTRVTPAVDPLYNQPVVEIEWAEEDALPFPFCVSAIGPAPECELIEDISLACGNVVLVGHGRRVEDEALGNVPIETTEERCGDDCHPPQRVIVPGKFRPILREKPLIFSQPLPAEAPASRLLIQDPRQALPQIKLTSIPPMPDSSAALFRLDDLQDQAWLERLVARLLKAEDPVSRYLLGQFSSETRQLLKQHNDSSGPSESLLRALVEELKRLLRRWTPQGDLLASRDQDHHFVVEMDNERGAHLRFGDDELGMMPEAASDFYATYWIGNGPAGNVGAETISHVVFRRTRLSGVMLRPRNPLPAQGGTAPEPIAEVKLFAPYAFRAKLERAITAEDYAQIVMRDFPHKVQQAAAALRWTGSWYEVLVAIDPLGQVEAGDELLDEIAGHLYRYRRIGHDLVVGPAHYVPLEVEIRVCVLPHYLRGHVKAALLHVFGNRILPDGRRGFFHPDNLTFGEGIYLSRLVAAAQAVPGVESVTVTRLERFAEGPNEEIAKGVLPLGTMEIARLDNDPSFPENGQLKLDVRGGR